MLVALAALFLSLGGVGYAAVALPAGSVGTAQLKNLSVTNSKIGVASIGYRKIQPGAVGTVRIDKNDVQLRVTGTCTTADQAITSVNINGGTTCGNTSPTETNTSTPTTNTTLTGTAATLATYSLPGGFAYYVQSAPSVAVKAGTGDTYPETVTVVCTLAAGASTTATETVDESVTLGDAGATHYLSVPLTVVAPESANAITSTVSCSESSTVTSDSPVVTAESTIYALNVNPTTITTATTSTTTTTTG
jgi:hypothetical protein